MKVLPKGRAVPSAHADAAARKAEYAAAIKQAKQLAKFTPPANTFVAGHDSGSVSWFRFFPRAQTVSVGQTVHFSISSKSEIHTVTLGAGTPYFDAIEKDLVMAQPQPTGPPRLQFSPLIFLPSDPALPPYTGPNHGNGFLNTGVLDTNPSSPPPASVDVTFAARRDLQVRVHDPPGDAGDDHGHIAGVDALGGPLACGGRVLSADHAPQTPQAPSEDVSAATRPSIVLAPPGPALASRSAGVYFLRGPSPCADSCATALRRRIARPCSASALASHGALVPSSWAGTQKR